MTREAIYLIEKSKIDKMEDAIYYLQHHNKNYTKNQEYMLDELEQIIATLRDNFGGYR